MVRKGERNMSDLKSTIETMAEGLSQPTMHRDLFVRLGVEWFTEKCRVAAREANLTNESAPREVAELIVRCFEELR